jgi:hypothetical protein
MTVTHEHNSLIGRTITKPPIERDVGMPEAAEASGVAGQNLANTMCVCFVAVSEQWEGTKNGMILRNETLEPVSAPGDWNS